MKSKFFQALAAVGAGLASLVACGLAHADGLPPYISPGAGTILQWLLGLIG